MGIEIFLSGYLDCDQLMGPLAELSGGMPPLAGEVLKRLEDVRSRVRYHG